MSRSMAQAQQNGCLALSLSVLALKIALWPNSCSVRTQIFVPVLLYLPQVFFKTIETQQSKTQFSKLSQDDKARVESILYLIDKFGVGDEFVHILSMTIDGLPKPSLFKQCRAGLNKNFVITSTPGKAPGVQHSFKQ